MNTFRKLPPPRIVIILIILGAIIIPTLLGPQQKASGLPASAPAVVLSISVPASARDIFTDSLLSDFTAAYPNITINVVTLDTTVPPAQTDLTPHLNEVGKLAASADVVFVDTSRLSPEAADAGYYLNLMPFVQSDKAFATDDFFPSLWQSFQWDQGLWALPIGANVVLLTYEPAAFDKLGMAYPSDQWSLDDLSGAIQKLAIKGDANTVLVPGMSIQSNRQSYLFRSLLADNLYDFTSFPNPPQLTTPDAEKLITTWAKLRQDGVVGTNSAKAPLHIGTTLDLIFQANTDQPHKQVGVLLPNHKAGLEVEGFAVSAGTQYPEQAYILASFLTTRPELARRFLSTAARKSLYGIQASNDVFHLNISPEIQTLIDQGVENGIPFSQLRYVNYLDTALNKIARDQSDPTIALQAAEDLALEAQKTAVAKKQNLIVAVATPIPVGSSTAGKITLNFELGSLITPLPNREQWDRVIQDFTAQDPQVTAINLNIGMDPLDKATEKNDCLYIPLNVVPSSRLDWLLNVDPFLTADSQFDKADFIGTSLAQLQRDYKTWGVPINIDPTVLLYDSARFSKAGLPAPGIDWTIGDFVDSLKTLKLVFGDKPPFSAVNVGGNHLLTLIAAYGGLPLDYRTNPPTINYSDAATVNAIRQVLDLAKAGNIKYDALGTFNFGYGELDRSSVIYTDTLSGATVQLDKQRTYQIVNYPRGSQFSGVSYTIGAAYISARTQNPDACYRWIKTLEAHPELFSTMPARLSTLKDPQFIASQGADRMKIYTQFEALLQSSDTIPFPSVNSGGDSLSGFLLQYWLYQVFDRYVLADGNLETSLQDAETSAKGFQACTLNLPPVDETTAESAKAYYKALGACAVKVDPSLGVLIGLMQ